MSTQHLVAQRSGRRTVRTVAGFAVAAVVTVVLAACGSSSAESSQYGNPVTPISAETIAGKPTTIPAPGEATVLIFYSVGCGTCVGITQHIATLAPQYPNAQYVAVNIDPSENVRTSKGFLEYIKSPAMVGVNDTNGEISKAYGVNAVSTIVVLNSDGQVVLQAVTPPKDDITAAMKTATA
ncbi:MAG: thioredoxin family protein [Candidatus Nanopelagicales bacterium]